MNKIAFITDVHGNQDALKAVLEEIDGRNIQRIICLGDVASFNANQHECMELIRQRQIEWIAGNHDLIAAGVLEPIHCDVTARFAGLQSRRTLDPYWKAYIRTLPLSLHEESFCAFHAGPLNVVDPLTREHRIIAATEAVTNHGLTNVVFFGHTHHSRVHFVSDDAYVTTNERKVGLREECINMVNVGSVGEPRGQDLRAQAAVFCADSSTVEFISVEYDFSSSRRKSEEGGWRLDRTSKKSVLLNKLNRKLGLWRHRLFPVANDDPRLEKIRQRMEHRG